MIITEFLNLAKHKDNLAMVVDNQLSITYEDLSKHCHVIESGLRENINDNCINGFILCIGENHALIEIFLAASSIAPTTIIDPNSTNDEILDRVGDLQFNYVLCSKSTANKAISISKILKLNVILIEHKHENIVVKLIDQYPSDPGHTAVVSTDVALILHTSGSTGKPKCVPLKHESICYNVARIAKAMQLSPKDKTVCVMPLFHVHGLFASVLSSIYSGSCIYMLSTKLNMKEICQCIYESEITWYTAVPTIHKQVLEHMKYNTSNKQHRLRFIRSCSSPLPATLREDLSKYYRVPILEAYGMTEATHQISMQEFECENRPGSVGKVKNSDIAIMSEEGLILDRNIQGEVVIRGKNVIDTYLFRKSDDSIINGYFKTGDIGYIDELDNLFLVSRIKEIVNKGGKKISPISVENILLRYPGIVDVACFSVPHETLGEDIHAAIVFRGDPFPTALDIKEFLLEQISIDSVPTIIHFVDSIPKSKTGKVQRNTMHKLFSKKLDPLQSLSLSRTEQKLIAIFKRILKLDDVNINDNFFELGGNSLLASELIYQIYQHTGVGLSYKIIFLSPTIHGLSVLVDKNHNVTDYFEYMEYFKNKINSYRGIKQ